MISQPKNRLFFVLEPGLGRRQSLNLSSTRCPLGFGLVVGESSALFSALICLKPGNMLRPPSEKRAVFCFEPGHLLLLLGSGIDEFFWVVVFHP
ncbi:hypothetical protein, partial [Corynebacterium riegelii]|uniref:hypothetical protein n=1 Tax=Corynebacterium riegelii TaxID=156976 RepID=UPI00288A6ADB